MQSVLLQSVSLYAIIAYAYAIIACADSVLHCALPLKSVRFPPAPRAALTEPTSPPVHVESAASRREAVACPGRRRAARHCSGEVRPRHGGGVIGPEVIERVACLSAQRSGRGTPIHPLTLQLPVFPSQCCAIPGCIACAEEGFAGRPLVRRTGMRPAMGQHSSHQQ